MHRPAALSAMSHVALLLLCLFAAGYFVRTLPEVNGDTRLVFVYSVVDHGTLFVDRYVEQAPNLVIDLAFEDGHYYMGKPPLPALLLVPVYALLRVVLPPAHATSWSWRWLLTLVLSGVSFAALVFLARRLIVATGLRPANALPAALAIAFGSPLLVYANLLFSHDFAAVLLLVQALLVLAAPRYPFWSGLVFGALIATEYMPAVAGAVLFAYHVALAARRSLTNLGPGLVGALAGVTPLLVYQTLAFGSPLANMYALYALPEFRSVYESGAIGAPRADVALALLLSPNRGLLVFAPLLIVGAFAAHWVWRAGPQARPLLTLCWAAAGAAFVANASFAFWYAGSSYGPRYLVSLLPLLCWPIAVLPRRSIVVVGLVASVPQLLALTSSEPLLDLGRAFPYVEYLLRGTAHSVPEAALTALSLPHARELSAAIFVLGVLAAFAALLFRSSPAISGVGR